MVGRAVFGTKEDWLCHWLHDLGQLLNLSVPLFVYEIGGITYLPGQCVRGPPLVLAPSSPALLPPSVLVPWKELLGRPLSLHRLCGSFPALA